METPRRFLKEAAVFLDALTANPETPAQLFSAFLYHEATENGKTFPCDQTPRNVFYIKDILELYPEARIINMIRDPRDVLLSQKRKVETPIPRGQRYADERNVSRLGELPSNHHQPYLAYRRQYCRSVCKS